MTKKPMFKKPRVVRKERTDPILHLTQTYTGDIHKNAKAYNRAFAGVLRAMADALEKIDDMWADPEVVVWLHEPGKITAELPLGR